MISGVPEIGTRSAIDTEVFNLSKCFVIQPFDGGKFDKRFDDVLAPAISAAALEPYRVDRDPSVSIPIEQIQSGIMSSRACLADITTDNPNVWFELGYAIASQREVVLICAEERTTKFPFDVQHRTIIKYSTESPSDFDALKEKITARLSALLKKEGDLTAVANMSSIASVQGLEQYEFATLIAIAQQLDGGVSANVIQDDMEKAGFTRIATMLGIRGLMAKNMVEIYEDNSWNHVYMAYRVTDAGFAWLSQNTSKLKLHVEQVRKQDDVSDPDEPF
jgi:hypothetical protein